jgi:hypothetical protein
MELQRKVRRWKCNGAHEKFTVWADIQNITQSRRRGGGRFQRRVNVEWKEEKYYIILSWHLPLTEYTRHYYSSYRTFLPPFSLIVLFLFHKMLTLPTLTVTWGLFIGYSWRPSQIRSHDYDVTAPSLFRHIHVITHGLDDRGSEFKSW